MDFWGLRIIQIQILSKVMPKTLNAIHQVRKHVFGVTQQQFAEIAGVQQSMVSRWENGQSAPTLEEMQRIREAAASRKLLRRWRDDLFFAEPIVEGEAA